MKEAVTGLHLAHGEPAGGAALHEVVWATAVGLVLFAALAALGVAHRSGRTKIVSSLGGFAERVLGLPAWSALPAGIAGGALLVAVFGFYWDVATHIDDGRDPGPFANPAHYFIIFGLLGIAVAGYIGVLLGRDPGSSSVRVRAGWHAPLGSVLLTVCGVIAVAGFPLDDMWHRLFGQDVTLWGPTHIQMVGGAALSTLALWVLLVEGERARRAKGPVDARRIRIHEVLVAGSFLIGLSALQAEFDYSVPQFRLLFHPVLLASAAAAALVPARIRLGRGGAMKAVAVFIVIRAALSIAVGPILGHTTLHFPLYVAEALLVELTALVVGTDRRVLFGASSGLAIGTVGMAAEWAWSHAWMTMSWPAPLLPEVGLAIVAGGAAGVLGAMIGSALQPASPRQRLSAPVVVSTGVVLALCLAYPLPIGAVEGSPSVALDDPNRPRTGATITVRPAELADDAEWFNVTAWQGGGSLVRPLEPSGPPGTYRAGEVPIHGEWKTLIRLHTGSAIVAVPIFLPEDPAIPAEEVPARASVTRRFVPDKQILLREAKDTPGWMSALGNSALGLIAIVWIAAFAWGLRRMFADGGGESPGDLAHDVRRQAALQRL